MDNVELAHKLCEKLQGNPTKTDQEIEDFLTTLKLLKYYKRDVAVSDLFLVLKDGKHFPMRQEILSFILGFNAKDIIYALGETTEHLLKHDPGHLSFFYWDAIRDAERRAYTRDMVQQLSSGLQNEVMRILTEAWDLHSDDAELERHTRENIIAFLNGD